MKKIIFLLIALISFTAIQAQIMKSDVYVWEYNGVAADTISATKTTVQKPIQLNKVDGVYYNAKVTLDSISGTVQTSVILQGKIFSDDTYTPIDTVVFYGTQADTAIVFTQNTNKVYYRYLNFVAKYGGGKAKINNIKLSIKK